MHYLKALAFAGVLSLAVLLPVASSAMTFEMFDVLAPEDQRDYVKFLAASSKTILTEQGRPDLAPRIDELFDSKRPKDPRASGEAQFRANVISNKKYLMEHPFPGLKFRVEDAFTQTLVANLGLRSLPREFHKSLVEVARTYFPKRPLRTGLQPAS